VKLDIDIRYRQESFLLDTTFCLDSPRAAVFGPSGSGKSTFLHLLAGLKRPCAGQIILDDEVLFDSAAGVNVPVHRRRVGLVFQDGRLFPHLTVEGNLRYGLRRIPAGGTRLRFDEVVSLLELDNLLPRRSITLSGGEQQRVALARALLAQPRLLLLDEPLAGVDANRKASIIPFLERVFEKTKTPVLIVSHDLAEILPLTRFMIVLEGGRLAGIGQYRDLLAGHRCRPLLGGKSPLHCFDNDNLTLQGELK
jgi:molybdate transport system ATP-binding protein